MFQRCDLSHNNVFVFPRPVPDCQWPLLHINLKIGCQSVTGIELEEINSESAKINKNQLRSSKLNHCPNFFEGAHQCQTVTVTVTI